MQGKLAVITGAASGLGRAFTERFAIEGMKVVLVDIEAPVLEATVEELRAAGLDVFGTVADVSSAEAMVDLAARMAAEHGPVHLLCNNAGGGRIPASHLGGERTRLAVDLRCQLLGNRQWRDVVPARDAGPW